MKVNVRRNGFTVLEAMVAIFVVVIASTGVFGLIVSSLSLTESIENEAIAWYLAQEGMELVRNFRDTNMLDTPNSIPWYTNIEGCEVSDNCGADYNDPALISGLNDTPTPLRYDAATGYTYDSGTASLFERRIAAYRCTVGCSPPGPESRIHLMISVTWQERGVDREVQLLGEVYNWED